MCMVLPEEIGKNYLFCMLYGTYACKIVHAHKRGSIHELKFSTSED